MTTYVFFTFIIVTSWIMQNIQVTKIGNISLILVPIYCMGYTNYIFSNKFGRLFRPNNNAVRNDVFDSDEARADNLIPEDAIFQRLRRAQAVQING